ncbi:hypothetical protein [Wolbachia endosymbiont of Armadillidium vulgare]|uniref:hypothetical protein n=1 Tax=Wolbachia endosymbiont of Armadillidium vulgare TaxID=77039 RepID=UPI000913EAC9|nr:hypothetical protein [Wolbachia endosymbiont of Armadillidium vulgare]OJH31267.1 hypothetical protein Wxf_00652 [Wolbachia endosymbiont of Armadillidium vulgare]OJH32422.1 hypothetical protein Wxf_01856 [Wolbachia endosymbiont of Armadillidium vulgare]
MYIVENSHPACTISNDKLSIIIRTSKLLNEEVIKKSTEKNSIKEYLEYFG